MGKHLHMYFILIFVMLVWGMNVPALKHLVDHFMPVTMSAFRIFTAGIIVLIILKVMKQLRWPTKQEWIFLIIVSIFNVFLHHLFLTVGLTETSASNGGIIAGMAPVLTAIFAIIFLGDKATFTRVSGFILGFIGISIVVLAGGGQLGKIGIGDVCIFVSYVSQAISFILIKKRSQAMDPRLMTGYFFVIGSIFLFASSLILEPEGLASLTQGNSQVWMVFFYSALFGTALGHFLYNYSMKTISASEAAIFINLNPFFALIGSVIFLNETIGWAQIAGFAFIFSGVVLGSGALDAWRNSRKKSIQNA